MVEIDTSDGPLFGVQYNDATSFLADGEVVLTFDDGPLRAYTTPVLEALDAHCTKATFFMVGRMAVADPEMVREVRAPRPHGRHAIPGRTPTCAHRARDKANAEIELGFSAVQQALGKPIAPFFRFPYLGRPRAAMARISRRATSPSSPSTSTARTSAPATPAPCSARSWPSWPGRARASCCSTTSSPRPARALPGLLAELKAKGYRVVHMRPKAPVATVGEFDSIVQSAADKKALAAGGGPLRRAVTWTVPLPPELAGSQGDGAAVQGQTTPAQKPAEPATPARAPKRGAEEEDWKAGLWRSY